MSPAIVDLVRILAAGAVDESARTAERPEDPEALMREAQRLASTGLQARDVAVCLGITEAAAVQLLERRACADKAA